MSRLEVGSLLALDVLDRVQALRVILVDLVSGLDNRWLLISLSHDGVDEASLAKLSEPLHHLLVGELELLVLTEQLVLLDEAFSSQGNVVILFIE